MLAAVAQCLRRAGVGAGARLCCALSGGVDSVVLLELLHRLRPEVGFSLEAAHVHHGLSPNASAWADACEAHCARLGVPFQVLRVAVDPAHSGGPEAAARAARHAALDRVPCDWMVFGHHQDDQAETLLFRLLRGAGVAGAAAMAVSVAAAPGRPGRLRPLLGQRRAGILAWARREALSWVEDESNADLRFARNMLRRRVLPSLEAAFPSAVPMLARACANFAEAEGLLADLAELDAQMCGGRVWRASSVLGLSVPRQANLLRWRLREYGAQAPSRGRLEEALRQLATATDVRPLRVALGNGWACCVYRGVLWLEGVEEVSVQAREWRGEAALPWGGGLVRFECGLGVGLSRVRLQEAERLVLAARAPGVRLQLAPGRPRQLLRKLCQEAGVPAWLRDRMPVLWADDAPVWVAGIGIACSHACAPDEAGVMPRWEPGARAGA